MAGMTPRESVWSAMSYTPPRGRCNYKSSMMSPACACLRYMLHPVKAATSFECDGCNHHASFHLMENPDDDAVLQKWRVEAAATAALQESSAHENPVPQTKKRRMIAQREPMGMTSDDRIEIYSVDSSSTTTSASAPRIAGSRRGKRRVDAT